MLSEVKVEDNTAEEETAPTVEAADKGSPEAEEPQPQATVSVEVREEQTPIVGDESEDAGLALEEAQVPVAPSDDRIPSVELPNLARKLTSTEV